MWVREYLLSPLSAMSMGTLFRFVVTLFFCTVIAVVLYTRKLATTLIRFPRYLDGCAHLIWSLTQNIGYRNLDWPIRFCFAHHYNDIVHICLDTPTNRDKSARAENWIRREGKNTKKMEPPARPLYLWFVPSLMDRVWERLFSFQTSKTKDVSNIIDIFTCGAGLKKKRHDQARDSRAFLDCR